MYIVEIIKPQATELRFNPEVFTTQTDAEEYLAVMMEDTHGLDGIITEIKVESARIVYRTF